MRQAVLKSNLNLSYAHTQIEMAVASAKTFGLLFLTAIFILSLIFTTVNCHHEKEDPEFQRCQSRCRHQHQHDPAQLKECQQRCEERRREKEGGGGGEGGQQEKRRREQLERCKQECQREHGEQEEVKVCEQQCEERFHGGGRNPDEEQGREGRSHPYTFGEERLKERVRTEDGRVRVTPRFGQQSELFRGIDNYRVALLEANPNSFVAPNHYDAEAIFFISRGTGVITFLREEKESANVERGDIVRVAAGTTFYVVNKDNSEKLHIVIFFQTVSMPGKYRVVS